MWCLHITTQNRLCAHVGEWHHCTLTSIYAVVRDYLALCSHKYAWAWHSLTSAQNAHTMEYKHIPTAQVRLHMARSSQGFAGSAGSGLICARSRSTIYSCMNFHAILKHHDNCTFVARNPKFSIFIFRLKNGKVGGYQIFAFLGRRAKNFSFIEKPVS